jgi:hypothetical protein
VTCKNCGQGIHEFRLAEFRLGGGISRMVPILVHDAGHERCEGRQTLAERA